MARPSKRDLIIHQARKLFLRQGFKGTSIDLVVAACEVSKPTVYNHFPDKRHLMDAVMADWLSSQIIGQINIQQLDELWPTLDELWWTPQSMAFYRLVIGEGWRFKEASEQFWRLFDSLWRRNALEAAEKLEETSTEKVSQRISHELWLRISHGDDVRKT